MSASTASRSANPTLFASESTFGASWAGIAFLNWRAAPATGRQAIADTANSVLATDASDEVLAVARTKRLDSARVSFASADAYNPTHIHYQRDFTAGFAAFWWSHVLMARLPSFLEHFHAALLPGARVVFADNRFVPGSSTPICRMDDAGNTYELRYLQDGSSHEVLKNFPSREQLLASIRPYSDAVEILTFDYHWCVTYDIKEA